MRMEIVVMHVWAIEKWKYRLEYRRNTNAGLRLRFEKNVDPEVRNFILNFAKWLRCEYCFPIRINVYVKASYRIRAKDGEMVVGTCWRPDDFRQCPYIRLATGDYREIVSERGTEQAMWQILLTFAHELTHYYQYINNLMLTPIGEERQATRYADYICSEYNDYLVATQGDKGTVCVNPFEKQ